MEFDRLAQNKTISYEDIKKFFAACSQFPSRKEIEDAVKACIQGEGIFLGNDLWNCKVRSA